LPVQGAMARIALFLSSVSAEFLSYRDHLRRLLTRPNVEVKVQEDFIVTGDETLEMLDTYIQGCDGVIHLVGDMTGAMARPQSVAAIAQRYPELGSRFPLAEFLQPDGPSLSYTQWEAWLALWHGKKLFIATPKAQAPRDGDFRMEQEQQAHQQAHLARLRSGARYPGCTFSAHEGLAAEVLRSFVVDLLVTAGLNPNLHTPHNLPERTTSSERFVGRVAELQRLAEILAPEGSRGYLTGMGGVGKSELALQHAYGNLDLYRGGIVRIDARQGLAAMASQLVTFFRGAFPKVALPDDKSPIELLPLCWSQWPAGAISLEPVLLILDDQRGENLPDDQGDKEGYAAEREFFAGLPLRFRRLISQREPAPNGAKEIELPLLQREASLELLALQAGKRGQARLQEEKQAADALCAEVGDLPLAVVLLGARLAERPELRLSQLLEDLQAKGAEARALQQAHPEIGAQRGVVEALLIGWQPLSAAAKSLGLLLGMMAPAVIPWKLVEDCRLPKQPLEEGIAFGDQQAELRRAQLLERQGHGLYRLHPVIRQFIRLQSKTQEEEIGCWRRQLAAAVAQVCRERFPETLTRAHVEALESLLPHIRQVAEHYSDEINAEDLLCPFWRLAQVAEHQSTFAEAQRWTEQGLKASEKRLGPLHPTTAAALGHLGVLMLSTNRLADAEPMLRRALAINEANYGYNHPTVSISLSNLGQLLRARNRLVEAETLMRRALAIAEASYGPDHPNVATPLNNLALVLEATNRLTEAEPLMRQALAIDEARYGADHINVARHFSNLAGLLMATNRLAEAESLMWRVLEIFEINYGAYHPNVAIAVNNLASLFQATNRLADAEPLYRRSLAIDEASYGPNHPNVARDLNNLAQLLEAINRLEEAEPLMLRALAIDEASYGPNHPEVARDLHNLAGLLRITNRMEESEPLMLRVVEIFEMTYGSDHPNVAKAISSLALLLKSTNRWTEAESLICRALAIFEISYGGEHPNVATSLNHLAQLMQATNRLAEAEPLMRRSLEIFIAFCRQGFQHPHHEAVFGNYKSLLKEMGLPESEIEAKLQGLLPHSS